MKAFGDGDHVCITSDYFENLQESPAVFLSLDNPLAGLLLKHGLKYPVPYEDIENLRSQLLEDMWPEKRHCPNWGRALTPCGDCEWCELSGNDARPIVLFS